MEEHLRQYDKPEGVVLLGKAQERFRCYAPSGAGRQPACILYDGPTTMVDPIMGEHLSTLMLRLKNQLRLTSVVVTPDLDLMYKVADRVVLLHEGRMIFFGSVADLDQCDHPHAREFLAMDRIRI